LTFEKQEVYDAISCDHHAILNSQSGSSQFYFTIVNRFSELAIDL